MAHDDWRIRIELAEREHAHGFLERLGVGLSSPAEELAAELADRRLAVSGDDDVVFVYAASAAESEQARRVVEAELAEGGFETTSLRVEQWLDDEDRWSDDPPGPDIDEEVLSRGYAPWEVRVECESRAAASELADRLEAEGYGVVRRFTYLLVGAASKEAAEELAARLHGRAEPSSELVWEVLPQNPFAVFGGLGGTGTPL